MGQPSSPIPARPFLGQGYFCLNLFCIRPQPATGMRRGTHAPATGVRNQGRGPHLTGPHTRAPPRQQTGPPPTQAPPIHDRTPPPPQRHPLPVCDAPPPEPPTPTTTP